MTRLFVAIWPPAPVIERLAAAARPAVEGVRWTEPEQWHVTLAFLGEVAAEAVAATAERLGALRHDPLMVALGERALLFERAMALPATGADGLATAVRLALGSEAPRASDRRHRRPFRGHLTVARLARAHGPVSFVLGGGASFEVGAVSLVASELRPDRSHYTIVSEVALR